MNESSIFGVSVRAWLALLTVGTGLGFLYFAAFTFSEGDLRLAIVQAVISFISLSLGYYLGQKNQVQVDQAPPEDQNGDDEGGGA